MNPRWPNARTPIPVHRSSAPLRLPTPGHRAYSGPAPIYITNRMTEAAAELAQEKARRALWSDCERRPFEMDLEGGV